MKEAMIMFMNLTEQERTTMQNLGKRYKNIDSHKQNTGPVTPVKKERIEDMFMSVNGIPEDYSFRGVINND